MGWATIGRSFIACGLLIGLAWPADGIAQPPERPGPRFGPRGPDGAPERFIEKHAEELGLSDEVRADIEKIVEDSRRRSEELRGELRDENGELRDLLKEALPDDDAVMKQAKAINEVELEQRKNRLKALMAIRALLTPEQREKLVEIREDSASRRNRGPLGQCRRDIASVCPGAEPGPDTLACLSEAWDDLSEECRASFENGGRWSRRRGRPGPRGE